MHGSGFSRGDRRLVGHGQRAPTLIERYADGLFLGIAQSGFTRVIGDPGLDEERATQVDLGLTADYDYWRGRAAVFYSWIDDYITLDGSVVENPPFLSARLFRFVNTDQATLAGFDFGKATLKPGHVETLAAMAETYKGLLASSPAGRIQAVGHTDAVGTHAFNDALARQRAETIRAALISRGIAPGDIVAVGRGKRELLIPTPDGVAEPRNRRVEIVVR